jgi:hypothetical protein
MDDIATCRDLHQNRAEQYYSKRTMPADSAHSAADPPNPTREIRFPVSLSIIQN